MILHTKFGLILTVPWSDEEELFLKFAIREIRQISFKNPIFFPRQAKLYQFILFALHSHYTGDAPFWIWFDLDNSLNRWKRPVFEIPFLRKSEVLYEKLTFFLGKSYQKFFLPCTLVTMVILHTMFGLIVTTPWPDEEELFINSQKFAIREIRKISFENPIFFLGKLSYTKIFLP